MIQPGAKEIKEVSVARAGMRTHRSDRKRQWTTHKFGRAVGCRVGEVSNRVIVWV